MKELRKYRTHGANAGWVVGVNLIRQLIQLAFFAVLVRELSKTTVGEFQLITAAIGLCGLFVLPGISSMIRQSVARGHLGSFKKAFVFQLAGGFTGGIVICIYAFLMADAPAELRNGMLIAGLTFPFAYGLAGWTDFQAGQGKFRLNAYWQAAIAIGSYSIMIALLLLGNVSLALLIFIPHLIRAAINLLALPTIFKQIPATAEPEPGGLRYGLEMSLYDVANSVGNYIDKFLIFYFLSPEVLAIFVVSERIPEICKKYFQQIRTVLVPSFSQKKRYTPKLDKKINMASAVVCCAILLVIFGVIPWFLPLVFTDAYSEAVLYCQLLLGTLIIGQIAQVRAVFIQSRFDAKAWRNITLGSNVVRLFASIALVPMFGIYGAIISTALYRLSTTMIVSYLMRRYH